MSNDATQNNNSLVMNKGLWGMTRPMLLEQALVFSIPVTDLFFLSRVSDDAAAAVGAITPILYFAFTTLWVVAFAGSSLTSQRIGNSDYAQANATIGVYAIWLLLLSALATLLVYAGGPLISGWMGLPAAIKIDADIYLQITAWMIGAWGIHALTHSVLTVFGLPQWNLIANSVYFLTNVFGNSCVIFGLLGAPKLGLVGVAWVSVGSSLVGVLIALLAIHFRLKLRFEFDRIRRDFRRYSSQLSRIALPGLAEPLSFDVQMIVLSGIVAIGGATDLAARAYTFNTFMLLMIVTIAIGTATEVIIAQHVGAGRYEQAKKQMSQSLRAAFIGSGIIGIIFLLLAPNIMALYTNEASIIAMAWWYFAISFATEPGRTVNIIVGNSLRGCGDGWFISLAGMAFTWLIAVPLAYFLAVPQDLGLMGVLIAAMIDELCRSVIYHHRWRQGHWRHTNAIAQENALQEITNTKA